MDVDTFVQELVAALQELHPVREDQLFKDDPIAAGRIVLGTDLFLNVFYNAENNKIAFGLIHHQQRIWGIDRDNIRDWHLHPLFDTTSHESIPPQSIFDIIAKLTRVLAQIEG